MDMSAMENLSHVYNQFKTSLVIFQKPGDSTNAAAKDMIDHVTFLSHATPSYPNELAQFPSELARFLESSARNLPWELRFNATQSLIFLINQKIVDMSETLGNCECTVLELFIKLQILGKSALNQSELQTLGTRALKKHLELQTQGDKALKKLAFNHVIQSIKNAHKNTKLQNILFQMLKQGEDEKKAKRALMTLQDLYRKKIWNNKRTANAICEACFHALPSIMKAALAFLIDCEKIEGYDASNSDDEQPEVTLDGHPGTPSKFKLKVARVSRNFMKKKQLRLSYQNSSNTRYYSPINHLKDAQGFAEKLFSLVQSSNEEIEMMMLKVIARTVGLHHLTFVKFYQYIEKYIQPHQTDVITIVAAAVEACHEMVPPDAVVPLFKQIVNQFVHDQSPPEAIRIGLNAVKEICLRMPLLMSEDLLQDILLNRGSHDNSDRSATGSLLSLLSQVCPSLLIKDRRRSGKAKPKAFGEEGSSDEDMDNGCVEEDGNNSTGKKRKFSSDTNYGIHSNVDNFHRVRHLKAKKDGRASASKLQSRTNFARRGSFT